MCCGLENPAPALRQYIEDQMRLHGLDVDAVPGLAGITQDVWDQCRLGADITLDTARALARVFGTDLVGFMVQTGMLGADEAPAGRDLSVLTSEEIHAEVGRRLLLS